MRLSGWGGDKVGEEFVNVGGGNLQMGYNYTK